MGILHSVNKISHTYHAILGSENGFRNLHTYYMYTIPRTLEEEDDMCTKSKEEKIYKNYLKHVIMLNLCHFRGAGQKHWR